MRKTIMRFVLAAAIVVPVATPTTADARNSTCKDKQSVYSYLHWYRHSKKLHGTRAPGRQILRFGTRSGKPSTCVLLRRSILVLKRQDMPKRAAQYVSPGAPWQPPAGTATVHAGSTLSRIAQCESGGNPRAISPGGTYRGKYQFDYGTWASVGGSGDPAAASEAEQDRRAAILYAQRGSSPWPVCGR